MSLHNIIIIFIYVILNKTLQFIFYLILRTIYITLYIILLKYIYISDKITNLMQIRISSKLNIFKINYYIQIWRNRCNPIYPGDK